MNCIFITIFNQEKYVDMSYLLLESIFIYGCLPENTHILIYTSTPFMNKIKQSHLFNKQKSSLKSMILTMTSTPRVKPGWIYSS